MTQDEQYSLQSKGFYLARQDGRLLSNEGDVRVYSTDGVIYTLRFGEVLVGPDANSDLSGDSPSDRGQGGAANRYLFISCEFDPSYFPEPAKPTSMDFQNKPEAELTISTRPTRTNTRSIRRGNARFRPDAIWPPVSTPASPTGTMSYRMTAFKKIHLSKAELTAR